MNAARLTAADLRPGMTVGLTVIGTITDVEHAFTGEVRLRFLVTLGGGQPIELVVQANHPATRIRPPDTTTERTPL